MNLIIYVLLFIVAFILAMFGKGGGEFYVPIFLSFSIPFQKAATTSLFILMVSGLSMMTVFHRKALLDWKLGFLTIGAAGIGSFIGGFISSSIPSLYLKMVFGLLLFISAYLVANPIKEFHKMKLGPRIKQNCCSESYEIPILVLPLIFVIGFVAGMVGISGGGLIVPLLVILGGVPLRIAFATNSVMVLFSSTLGFLGHGLKTGVDWNFALPAALSVALGAILGAHFSTRVDIRKLKKAFIFILLFAGIWMIIKAFESF